MKTLCAAILGLLLSLALLEGLCQGYYYLHNKSAYDSNRLLGAIGAGAPPETANSPRLPDLYADQREVLHPYTGYVRDYNDAFRAHFGYDTDHAPLAGRTPDRLTIALFGGSVAMHLHAALEKAFAAALAKAGDPRKAVLVNFALGGYKQPQQLMTLDYFLAQGAAFDVVVNLDGFNEITLSYADNLAAGVSPFYPRLWNLRLSDSLDPARLKKLVAIAAAREKLEDVVAGLRAPVLSRSAAWGLWSSWRAGRLQRVIAAQNAASGDDDTRSFAKYGPPFAAAEPRETMRQLAQFWARCSRLMDSACKASGSAYFHFLQPNQYVPDSKTLTAEEKATAFAPDQPYSKAAVLGYPAFQEAGRELAAAGIAYFDATPLFKDHPETLYLDACCHINEQGNDILAAFIVDRVLGRR